MRISTFFSDPFMLPSGNGRKSSTPALIPKKTHRTRSRSSSSVVTRRDKNPIPSDETIKALKVEDDFTISSSAPSVKSSFLSSFEKLSSLKSPSSRRRRKKEKEIETKKEEPEPILNEGIKIQSFRPGFTVIKQKTFAKIRKS